MTNEEVIQKVHEEARLRDLSLSTERDYIVDLKCFIRYHGGVEIADMDTAEIRAFLLYLLGEKKRSTGSVNRCNSALRFVFGGALQKTLNYQMIPRCRAHRDLPDILSKTELAKLFASIDNLRDKAILETIYGAGLRISEITHLRVQDIDSENMRLFVHHGKGKKDRWTLLSITNLELLREYWKQYRPKNPDGYLFYSRVGHYKQLTLRTVQNIMKKYLTLAGLPTHYTVHTLRHCFATHLLEDGVDVCRIKSLMGHTHIQSTTFYLHLVNFDGTVKSPLDTLPKKRGPKPKAKEAAHA